MLWKILRLNRPLAGLTVHWFDFHKVAHHRQHSAKLRRVVVNTGIVWAAKPKRSNRPFLFFWTINNAAYLRDLYLCHDCVTEREEKREGDLWFHSVVLSCNYPFSTLLTGMPRRILTD